MMISAGNFGGLPLLGPWFILQPFNPFLKVSLYACLGAGCAQVILGPQILLISSRKRDFELSGGPSRRMWTGLSPVMLLIIHCFTSSYPVMMSKTSSGISSRSATSV